MSESWTLTVRLVDIGRGGLTLTSEPDASAWPAIAKAIGVDALQAVKAEVQLKPWLDGAEFEARATAIATQTCGITLEPFDVPLEARFTLHFLPQASPNAPPEDAREVLIDPEGEDPPEILDGDVIDVGAYLIEHLALEVDPFPRKPEAVFEPPENGGVLSPFAALAVLKTPKDTH